MSGTDDIAAAERVLGLAFTPAERAQMETGLARQRGQMAALRTLRLPREVAPATRFDPRLPGWVAPPELPPAPMPPAGAVPDEEAALLDAPAWRLLAWMRDGRVAARRVAELALERIERRNGAILAFATVTGDRAIADAERLDATLAATGRPAGPLHGLPYGMKDIVDTAGIVTDWGAEPFRGRVPATDAHVTALLREAGAVMLGKTAVGALAYGDLWHGGRTRNPWRLAEGSSGSSAGSASAVAAGLCPVAIGTETYGSIVSPAVRCRCVGFRPGFGRVSRRGVMALCPSLDKVGVLARDPLDAAIVGEVLRGADALDPAFLGGPSLLPPVLDPARVRIGWRGDEIEPDTLATLRAGPFAPVELAPRPALPWEALGAILEAEAAASFAELTDGGEDDRLSWQDEEAWPNTFRRARFHLAVDHVQLDRLRRLAMEHVGDDLARVDAVATSPGLGPSLLLGNFTGHPALSLPGFGSAAERSIVLLGRLFDEARLLALGARLTSGRAPAAAIAPAP